MRKAYLKRATAVTMAAMMLSGNVPIQPVNNMIANMNVEAFASEITGTGTEADPYVISTVQDWATFAANINAGINADAYYQLSDDFNSMEAVTAAVGTLDNPFKGVFDGNGKTVIVSITDTQTQGAAPFRAISDGAEIKNLTVEGTVTGTTHASGLVGFSKDGTTEKPNKIEGCIVNTEVSVPATSGSRHMGGVVGHALESYLEIDDTIFGGKMTSTGDYAGGFQGWSDGAHLTMNNCLFKGSYSGNASFHPVAVQNGSNSVVVPNVSNCYYIQEPTLKSSCYVLAEGTRVFVEKPFGSISNEIEAVDGNLYYTMVDSVDALINSADDWNAFADAVKCGNTFEGQTIMLNEDIVVSQMVGTSDNKFKGTFLGCGHTLTFNYGTQDAPVTVENAAPFAYMENATVCMLNVKGTIYTSSKYGAGIAAHTYGNCTIESCVSNIEIESSIKGDGTHAGFVGVVDGGTLRIANCLFSGIINGASTTKCGGFVGWRGASLTMEGCLMNGEVNLSDYSGSATFNRNNEATINQCYYYTTCGDLQGTEVGEMTNEELVAALGSGWTLNDDEVAPMMDMSNLADALIIGLERNYIYNGEAVALDYEVLAADGKQLVKDVDYTAVLTSNDEEVEAVDGIGDYQLTITAIEGSGYNGSIVADITVDDAIAITADTTKLRDGYTYKVNSNVTVSNRINVKGNVTLLLNEGCTLTASKGIEVSNGNTLTIEGAGTLNANGASDNAGIGSENVGTIIINGGTINARGGSYAAGIGGSKNTCNGGTIIINGGIVNATGGYEGSGIGGGYDDKNGNYGQCGNIIINGGQITARGGSYAFGIGTGYGNGSNQYSGSLTLGWTNESDFIDSNSYRVQSIQFAEGKSFVAEGNIVDTSNLGGKKLLPLTESSRVDVKYASVTGIEASYLFTDEEIPLVYTVTAADGTVLTENEDYTVELKLGGDVLTAVEAPGSYSLTVTGIGVYTGTTTINFTVSFPVPNGLKHAVSGETSATLEWNVAEVADYYVLEYSLNEDFSEAETIDNISATTIDLDNLVLNAVYYARVKAVKGTQSSAWSGTLRFETSNKIWLGSGDKTSNVLPTHNWYRYSTTQQIYTAEELGGAGAFASIDFFMTDGSSTRNMDIYMVHTDKTQFNSGSDWVAVTENDRVFSGNVAFAYNTWTTIELDSNFIYNGTDNIVIVIDDNTGSYPGTKNYRAYSGGDGCSLYAYSDSTNLDPLNNYSSGSGSRTNMKNQIRLAQGEFYPVLVEGNLSHGTVIPDHESAAAGQIVTLSADAEENYEATKYIVKDEEGNEIEVTNDTFRMPKGQVTVSAEFDVITYHSVSVDNEIVNGKVTADKVSAAKGNIITLTTTPDYGYKLSSLTVKDEDGNEIHVTNNTFKMPWKNVTIYAEFEEVPYYTISIDNSISNGTITANYEAIYEGELVSFEVTPDYGFNLASMAVKDAEGNEVTVTDNTFIMPAGNVVITAEFVFPVITNFTNAELLISGAVFEWDALDDIYSYVLEYSTDETFANATTIDNITTNTVEISELTADTVYYVRVKAVAGENEGDWSETVQLVAKDKMWLGYGDEETNSSYLPTNIYYNYSVTQQIYSASEIKYSGSIRTIQYMMNGSDVQRSLEIYMISTDKDSFGTEDGQNGWFNVTAKDRVFSGTVNFTDGEWTTITLDKAFAYNANKNLVIVVYDKTGKYVRGKKFVGYSDDESSAMYVYRDSRGFDITDLSNVRGTVGTTKSQVRIGIKTYKEGWKKDDNGWWYQNADGTYPINQWKKIGEDWYHFDENGYVMTGWYKEGNTYYYLKSNGALASDEWVEDDKYYIDANGKWVQGASKEGTWKEDANGKWYKNADGSYPKDQWKKIDGNWYRFNENGYVVTGWYVENGVYYYLKEDGSMAVNEWVENDKYYLDENGHWVKGKTKEEATGTWKEDANGKWYKNADGSCPKDQWKKIDGNWYRFDENGYVITGWYLENGAYYYLKEDGSMAADEWVENGKYYIDANGHWVKGAVAEN
ncbi:MAG: fibronectin type III domain-containing protein [Lachnospiraceae bacterium]|nr:fibronectin type III domain-containing protein [Lachnospiraceae bacterium]